MVVAKSTVKRLGCTGFALGSLLLIFGPPDAFAQHSGLLIGFRTPSTTTQYRTIWIPPKEGAVLVGPQGPTVIVRRKDGFWRVGVRMITFWLIGHPTIWKECYAQEELWAIPAQRKFRWNIARNADKEACDPNVPYYGSNQIAVEFIGADYVATKEVYPGRRGDIPRRVWWIERGHLSYLADISTLVGDEAERALHDLARKAVAQAVVEDREENDPSRRKLTDAERTEMVRSLHYHASPDWGVRRGPGRWVLVGRILPEVDELGPAWFADFELPQAPPTSLVGHGLLFPPWETIVTKVPGARDAFSSPAKDMLVVVTKDTLLGFPIRNGAVGEVVVRLPLVPDEIPVMAQWAVGPHVERWSRQLRKLLKP